MVSANEIRKLAERLAKAEALVESGAVFPVAGLEGYAVVRNGNGDSMYLVRFDAGKESCTCPDFQQRQSKLGQPCKHQLSVQIFNERATGKAEEESPAEAPATTTVQEPTKIDVATEIKRLKGQRSIALLNGDDDTVYAIDTQLAFYGVAA